MTQDKELVVRALRRLAEQARSGQDPAAHPSVEELVAYHASELSPDRDREIQQHLVTCWECPELILALDGFADLAEDEPALPAGRIDKAWESVRHRLVAEGWFQGGAERLAWSWAALFAPRRLVATVAVAALACLVLYLVLYAPAALRQPRIVGQPEVGAPSLELPPAERGVRGVQELQVHSSAARFYLAATLEGAPHSEYQVELRTAGATGRRLWSSLWRPTSSSPDLAVEIPRGYLQAGEYRLVLRGREGGRPVDERPDVRRFRLSYD